jgi:rubredoxin
MQKYRCLVCDWVYDPDVGDPEHNIPPGTPFDQLPDDWVCPLCFVGKEDFEACDA